MAERLAGFVHAYTMYWSVRPFGSAVLIAGKDADGPFLWMVCGPLLSAACCCWIVPVRKQLQTHSMRPRRNSPESREVLYVRGAG